MKKLFLFFLQIITTMYATDFNHNDFLPIDDNMLHGQLENGLTYYIKRNSEPNNMAEFRLALRVGAILEEDDQLGIAHFVEHLAFSGTEHFPSDSLRVYLNSLGFGFMGGLNAFTAIELTCYMLSGRTTDLEQLDTSILILSDWASRITFEEEMIDKERGIILEEMRGRRGASDRLQRQLYSTLFEGSKYTNRIPIGTAEIIETVPRQRILDFFNDWYHPSLMAVIAVGDFNPEDIEAMIHKHFNTIPSREMLKPVPEITIPTHSETKFSVYTDSEATRTNIFIYYKHPGQTVETVENYKKVMIDRLLNMMLQNRFTEISRSPNPPFISAYSYYARMIKPVDTFTFSATVDEHQILEGFTSLVTEIERARRFGFHNSELIRAKAVMQSNIQRSYNERDNIPSASRAMSYAMGFMYDMPLLLMGPENEFELNSFILNEITMDDIMIVLNNNLTEENRVVTISAPDNIAVEIPTEDVFLSLLDNMSSLEVEPFPETILDEPLLSNPPRSVRVRRPRHDKSVDICTWTLRNGATVYLKETDFRNDEILFNSFRFGGLSQVEDSSFLSARVANTIMSESGIGDFDNNMLDIYLDGKVVNLTSRIGNTAEGISGSSSVSDFETLMQLIYLNFTNLRLNESAFTTWKNRTEISTRNLQNSPQNSFNLAVNSLLYNDHFRMQAMTIDEIDDVSHQVAYDFYNSRFDSVNDFSFVFVGNISHRELHPYIEKYIATLPNKNSPSNVIDRNIRFNHNSERREVFHGQEDRTIVRLIFPSTNFKYSSRESAISGALNSILWEALNENVREKISGVYMISPSFSTETFPVEQYIMNIYFGCDPHRVDEIIEEVNNQLLTIINNEFDEKYIQTFKETIRRSLETSVRTNNFWLSRIIGSLQYKNEFSEILNAQEMADSITREEIAEFAKRNIDLDKILTIILFPEE